MSRGHCARNAANAKELALRTCECQGLGATETCQLPKAGNEAGAKFVESFGIGATCDFTITTHGNEEGHALAEAWVHRAA